jgi:hypothetical protein
MLLQFLLKFRAADPAAANPRRIIRSRKLQAATRNRKAAISQYDGDYLDLGHNMAKPKGPACTNAGQ